MTRLFQSRCSIPASHPRSRSGWSPKFVPKILSWLLGGRKSGRHAGVQGSVGLADEITARYPPGPDIAELIEMIEPAAANKNQTCNRLQRQLAEDAGLLSVIADKASAVVRKSCEMNGRSCPALRRL